MPNNKWLEASLILSSALLVMVFVLGNGLNINSSDQLALAYKIGSTVKITPVENSFPLVSINAIESNQTTTGSISCQSSDFLTRYFEGSATKYNEKLTKDALCLKGRVQATYYKEQSEDDVMSIAAIDTMIADVQKVLDAANQKDKLNHVKVAIIPGGYDSAESYPFVDNVSIKCLKNKATVVSAETGISTGSKQSGSKFLITNDSLESLVKELKSTNDDISKKLQGFKDANEPVPNTFIIKLVFNSLPLADKMANKLVAITPEALHTDYPDLESRGMYMTMSIDLDVDANGKVIDGTEKIPGPVRWAIKTKDKDTDKEDPWLVGSVSVDGTKYPTVPLPIQFMANKNNAASAAGLIRLKAIKKQYENRMAQNEAKRKALEAKNYNCTS